MAPMQQNYGSSEGYATDDHKDHYKKQAGKLV